MKEPQMNMAFLSPQKSTSYEGFSINPRKSAYSSPTDDDLGSPLESLSTSLSLSDETFSPKKIQERVKTLTNLSIVE